jgi:VIT1/CCC1 family predicted Fe2+/Mn2+ transporter
MASPGPPLPDATHRDINPRLLIDNYHGELDAAALYRTLARREGSKERSALLLEMAEAEDRHATVMATRLAELGVPLPKHRTGLRTRVLALLARLFGPRAVFPIMESFEATGASAYREPEQDAAVHALAAEERSHFRTLGHLARPQATVDIAQHERWHRTGGGGTLRATVFGVSDGLVSNLALVMGFAGAQADAQFLVLAGIAGLLAGACSMGAGEYISMRAQRELLERQIQLEEIELLVSPEEERAELALIYRAKGVPADEAERLADRILEDPQVALDTLVREELGLDPEQLGSPWGAAIGSFLAFAVGAILPVIAYFSGAGWLQFGISGGVSALALFLVGASVSLFTGRSALYSGGRQLLVGAAAAAITFGIGSAIGAGTGI